MYVCMYLLKPKAYLCLNVCMYVLYVYCMCVFFRRSSCVTCYVYQVLMHSSARSPCLLAQTLHNTDVLLTPHGMYVLYVIYVSL